jgi:hypothetical protein
MGLRYCDALLQLGGWLGWLRSFTDDLANNTRFADLGRKRINASLERLPRYFLAPQAVGAAMRDLIEPRMLFPWQLAPQDVPARNINGAGNISIQVRWCDFTNKEIGEEMEKFAALMRPPNYPEPVRCGQKPEEVIRSYLKALCVMRICKLHKSKPWKKLELVAEVCGYKGCRIEAAEYKSRCKQGHGDRPMGKAAKTEMSDARARALEFFRRLFPGETPSNY